MTCKRKVKAKATAEMDEMQVGPSGTEPRCERDAQTEGLGRSNQEVRASRR